MKQPPLKQLCGLLASAAVALVLIGCNGSAGSSGQNGVNGSNGSNGANGTNGANGVPVTNVAALTSDQWVALNPVGTITGVTVSATQGQPVVNFKLTDSKGNGLVGLENYTKLNPATDLTASYPNFTFTIAKLIPAVASTTNPGTFAAQSKWVNYMVVTTPNIKTPASIPTGPTTDGNGTLVGHGDGTYTYTFATDITKVASLVTAYGTANSVDVSALDPTNLVFDPNAPTRVVIEFFGNARGTGSGSHTNTPTGTGGVGTAEIQHPLNIVYDFTPATGAVVAPSANSREIVTLSTCNNCHTWLAYHGGHRVDPKNCVTCHTDQRRYGYTEATRNAAGTAFTSSNTEMVNGTAEFDFDQLIHQIHMGSNLSMAGHDITPDNTASVATATVAGEYAINFPQNTANCGACHVASTATPQAGNWQTTPSRAACGGCHDNVYFAAGHAGGVPPQTDDHLCGSCHGTTAIQVYHTPLMSPAENGTNVSAHGSVITNNWQSTSFTNAPAGAATVSYNIASVTVNATGNPVVTFQILINGSPAILNPFVAGTTPVTGEAMPSGFAAGPNFALAMGIPQDGITPTDFNYGHNDSASWNLRQIWNLTAKVKSGALLASKGVVATATAGTYSITMDGYVVPTGTKLVAIGIGTSSVVQTNLTAPALLANRPGGAPNFTWTAATAATGQGLGGVELPATTVWASATSSGFVARRQIIKPGSCQTCHANLGTFTTNNLTTEITNFHGGQMNEGSYCVFCHYSTGNSTGFSYNAKTWVHALHAAGMRANPYTIQANFPSIIYPGKLNDCEACHVPGSYDFSNSTNAGQISGMLWDTVATGTGTGTTPTFTTGPWVSYTAVYGPTQTFAAPATPSATWVVAQPAGYGASAVSSPITAACAACHDTATDITHMTGNGGVWYSQRQNVPTFSGASYTGTQGASIVLQSNEQCLVCHGHGGVVDIQAVHMNF
jgi:OmcA/MtrC family decaheme c-type cytochrome